MRAKSKEHLRAEQLRREQGLSYNEIAALTRISKSTLSAWLRDIPLTLEQETRLQERLRSNRSSFAARALPINRERHQRARQRAYQSGVDIAKVVPDQANIHELALAMLYLGEGAKRNSVVQIANTDPNILRFFLWTLRQIYNIDEKRLSFRLNLIEAARSREENFIVWWCQQLGCSREQFRKTQFDPRSHATHITDNYRGVCTVNYNDLFLQQHILGLAHAYIQGKQNDRQK